MVDNPDKLCTICLHKFASLLKYDELIWKKQIEECIDQIYRAEKNQSSLNDQRKRKYYRTDEDNIGQLIDYNLYEVNFNRDQSSVSNLNFFVDIIDILRV
jgi:hypothetical protein